jgi:uncharacterized protein YegJ (DUF2314 family)
MIKVILNLVICFGTIACGNIQPKEEESESSSNLYMTPSEDKEMNEAVLAAKETIDQFQKALLSNQYDNNTFALKVRFPTEIGAEHIWATGISLKDGEYYGTIDNLPTFTTKVSIGEEILLESENITDWMYGDNGVLRGGYTLKLIRSRMTKEEQEMFDNNFQLKIVD